MIKYVALNIANWLKRGAAGLMNWGKRAAKKTTALGFAAEVIKPCQYKLRPDLICLSILAVLAFLKKINRKPKYDKYATPAHFTTIKKSLDVCTMLTKPMDATIICKKLALRSPAAVNSDFWKPFVMLLESIKSWLGPGVLIKINTVLIYKSQISVPIKPPLLPIPAYSDHVNMTTITN